MTQSNNNFRKIFIDSRWRNSGGHNDFSIELPSDVDTTRTTSVYLASCSFSNTFETVLSNVNDWLYFVSEDTAHVPSVVSSNNKVYVLADNGTYWIWIPANARLAYFAKSTASTPPVYQLIVTALPTGQWTLAQFATILRTAIDPQGTLGTTVTTNATNYAVQYAVNGSSTQLYLPPAGEIDSLLASTGASISGDYTRGTSSQLFNASWGLFTGGFTWAATIPQPNPRGAWPYVLTLPSASNIFLADLAASLQTALRTIIVGTTVTVAGSVITINTGDNAKTFRFPTYQELTNAAWKRANWPSDIVDYAADPQAYNELMPLPSPSVSARVTALGTFPAYTQTNVIPMNAQQYNTGADLAADLQVYIRSVNANATVIFYSNLGTLVIQSPPPWTLQFPTDRELRDASWRAAYWDPYPTSWIGGYDLTNPHSLNAQLYFPSPSVFKEYTITGNIDMIPYREVYLSSSLTNFRTLQTGLGAQDILARIPIDVNYGEVVTFRAYNHDAISASDQHFRVMRFRFTDYAGRLVPIDQPVVIELVFLDSDPYAM